MYMQPIIKYRGGKSKELHTLIPHIPHFEGRYIEPFFGGGAMYFHLEPEAAIINDINTPLINFYKGVRNNYSKLRKELDKLEKVYKKNRKAFEALKALHPNERVEDANESLYYQIRDMYNGLIPSTISRAAIYYFINKTAYSGMIRYNSKGEFNVPYGRYKHLNTSIVSKEHSDLLKKAEIYNGDYQAVFEIATQDDFIFLDPPYDCIFSDYGNEVHKDGFGEDNHRQLAQDIRNLPCPALLVIGKTPLIEELYDDMIIGEYDKSYSVNIRNRFKAESKHLIITNY